MPDGALAARAAAGEKTIGGAALQAAPPCGRDGHRGVARHVGGGRSAPRHHRPMRPVDGTGVAAGSARDAAATGRDAAPGGARAVGDGPVARRAAHAGVPMTGMSEEKASTAGAEGPWVAERAGLRLKSRSRSFAKKRATTGEIVWMPAAAGGPWGPAPP